MAELYRKSALDKLSSPEQLDKMITIISPSFWIALCGGGAIILTALIWSIAGSLPIHVTTNGIYRVRGGVFSIHADISGTVDEVLIQEGEDITVGSELVRLDSLRIQRERDALTERRNTVEVVTFDSEDDIPSADNKALLDLKSQKIAASAQLVTNQTLLDQRRGELAEQEQRTAKARTEFEAAQKSYFDSMESEDTSEAQIAYQSAQTELANSRQYLENARSALGQVQSGEIPLLTQKSEIEANLGIAREELEEKRAGMETARSEMFQAQDAQQRAQTELTAAQTELTAAQSELSTAYSERASAYSERISAEAELTSAESQLEVAEAQLKSAQADYDDKAPGINEMISYYDSLLTKYRRSSYAAIRDGNSGSETQLMSFSQSDDVTFTVLYSQAERDAALEAASSTGQDSASDSGATSDSGETPDSGATRRTPSPPRPPRARGPRWPR